MLNDPAKENGRWPFHRMTPQELPESLNRRTTRYPEGELDHQNKWELKTNPISLRVKRLSLLFFKKPGIYFINISDGLQPNAYNDTLKRKENYI
jgi:hypothetical protein